MKQAKSVLPVALMFSSLALAHEGIDVELSGTELFSPHCSYRVYIDELKSGIEATSITENELTIAVTVDTARYTNRDEVMLRTIELIIPAEDKKSATTSRDVPSIETLETRQAINPELYTGGIPSVAGEYRQALSGKSYIYKHSCKQK